MRRLLRQLSIPLLVLLCLALFPYAGASTGWSKTYDGGADEYGYAIVKAQGGGYAVAGEIVRNYNSIFDKDFYLLKTDAQGNLLWNKSYGNMSDGIRDSTQIAYAVVATADGGFALAGVSGIWQLDSFTSEGSDFWLVKTDAEGNMQWNRTYGGEGKEYMEGVTSMVISPDGGYVMAGYQGAFRGEIDIWLVKTDSDGNMLWNKTFQGNDSDTAHSLITTADGGYAIVGASTINATYTRTFLIKTDPDGNMLWNKTYGAENDFLYSLVQTADGGYALAGGTQITGNADFWLVKTDQLGVIQWNKTFGGQGTIVEQANVLVSTSDGGYALAGEVTIGDFAVGNKDVWLVKTDALGVMEWNQTYASNDSNFETAYGLVINEDGGYTLVCSSLNVTTSKSDIWLIRTDGFGVIPENLSLLTLTLVIATTLPLLLFKKRLFAGAHNQTSEPTFRDIRKTYFK